MRRAGHHFHAGALALVSLLALSGCGLRSETSTATSTVTSTVTSTTAAPAATGAPGSTTTATADGGVPSTTGSGPATSRPTTTGAGGPSTTGARQVPAEAAKFCELIQSVAITDLPDANWTAGYQRVRKALADAVPIAPPAVKVAISDLAAVVDSLAPEVDAGKVSSNAQLDLWFNTQDTATKTKVLTAGKQIQLYLEGNCVG